MSIFTLATVPKPRTAPVEVDGVTVVDGRAYLNESLQHQYGQRTVMPLHEADQYRAARRAEREAAVREREDLFNMIRNLRTVP